MIRHTPRRSPARDRADEESPEDRLARVAKSLAHPARIRILGQFRSGEPRMVHEIVEQTHLAQSTVSEHLRILREAGVLLGTPDGPRTWYSLRRGVLRALARDIEQIAADPALTDF